MFAPSIILAFLAHLLLLPSATAAILPRDVNTTCTALPTNFPLTFETAYTIILNLGPTLPSIPIPDSNGTYGIHPVLNGTISGPLINGIFTGGAGKGQFFADHFVGDDTQYGMTDDGEEFILTHYTSGSGKGIVFRAVLWIGGTYSYLTNSFLIGSVTTTGDATSVGVLTARVFLVGSPVQTYPES